MGFGSGCRPGGGAKFSAADARRVAGSSPLSCRASTQAPDVPEAKKPRAAFSFPRSHRLTRGEELQGVRREGKRIRTEHLEVRALASLLLHPRIGIIVPRHRRTIVDRNRLRRRIRELARTRLIPAIPPADVVVFARPEAYQASFAQLADEIGVVAEKVHRAVNA